MVLSVWLVVVVIVLWLVSVLFFSGGRKWMVSLIGWCCVRMCRKLFGFGFWLI